MLNSNQGIFVTITGLDHYYGKKPFKAGRVLKLVKDKENAYDCEAIKVVLPHIDTVGYVANSYNTVFEGTFSAGRLYDKMQDEAYAVTMFVTHSSVIALVMSKQQLSSYNLDFDFEKSPFEDEDAIKF